jgi:hypothetical protein
MAVPSASHPNLDAEVRIRETNVFAGNDPQPLPDIGTVAC